MRRPLLLLALLAGCDRGKDDDAGSEPSPVAATMPQLTKADVDRMLQDKAKNGLRAILPDPDDARFAELRAGTAGAVCGKVDTKQPDGKRSGPRPFLVTPDGVGVISLTPTIMLNDPEDIFPDYYIRWCATPAELATLEVSAELNTAVPVTELPPDLPELAGVPDAPPAAPQAIEAPPQAEPRPAAPATSTDLESFSKAVIRGQGAKEEPR